MCCHYCYYCYYYLNRRYVYWLCGIRCLVILFISRWPVIIAKLPVHTIQCFLRNLSSNLYDLTELRYESFLYTCILCWLWVISSLNLLFWNVYSVHCLFIYRLTTKFSVDKLLHLFSLSLPLGLSSFHIIIVTH